MTYSDMNNFEPGDVEDLARIILGVYEDPSDTIHVI